MPLTRRGPFPLTLTVLLLCLAACTSAEEPDGAQSPYDVARAVREHLGTETSGVTPAAHDEEYTLGWCRAAAFDPPREDTYKVTGRFVFAVAAGTDIAEANAPVEALYDRWHAAGWDAELHFGDTGLARATATDPDGGYAFNALPDLTWTRLIVTASSPCHSYPDGKSRDDYSSADLIHPG